MNTTVNEDFSLVPMHFVEPVTFYADFSVSPYPLKLYLRIREFNEMSQQLYFSNNEQRSDLRNQRKPRKLRISKEPYSGYLVYIILTFDRSYPGD
jgi:hypothetical protein